MSENWTSGVHINIINPYADFRYVRAKDPLKSLFGPERNSDTSVSALCIFALL